MLDMFVVQTHLVAEHVVQVDIVAGCSRCSIVPSIPLIDIHIKIELIAGRILSKSAFSETGAEINKHFSGLEVTDVLCEESVLL